MGGKAGGVIQILVTAAMEWSGSTTMWPKMDLIGNLPTGKRRVLAGKFMTPIMNCLMSVV